MVDYTELPSSLTAVDSHNRWRRVDDNFIDCRYQISWRIYIVTKVSDSSAKVTEELVQMVDDA